MTTPHGWEPIRDAITTHRTRDLITLLGALDDPAREALVAPLKALAKTPPGGLPPWDVFGGLAIAGAAILPDAKTTAAWLRRFDALDLVPGPRHKTGRPLHGEVAEVLLARDASWLPRLVELWADGLRIDEYHDQPYLVVEQLRTQLDLDPVASHGYVAGWVYQEWFWRGADPVDRVRTDPRFAALVPVVLDIDDVLPRLRMEPDSFVRLVATDGVDRAAVLDAALSRLQRGGRPAATDSLVHLYRALEPTLEENQTRVRDLLALLPGTRSMVAGLAQESLFALHDAGLLSSQELAEASTAVFGRTEKKLVRAQLTRLRAHAAAHPDEVTLMAQAAAGGLANPAVDVQRDTIKLLTTLAKSAGSLDSATVDTIRDAAQFLPPDLVPALDSVLGTPVGGVAAAKPVVLAAPTAPAPQQMTPITSTEELIERFLVLARAEGNRMQALDLERVVEAIPRLAGAAAFQEQAGAVLADEDHSWIRVHYEYINGLSLRRGLFALLAAGFGEPLPTFTDRFANSDPAPQQAIATRLFSLADSIIRDPSVRTIAFPTWTTGSIKGQDLLGRLRVAADQGWQPDPVDLEQSLLRLELSSIEDGPRPFADLHTAAGERAAAWIADGGIRTPDITNSAIQEYRDTPDDSMYDAVPATTYVTLPTLADPAHHDHVGPLWTLLTTPEQRKHGFWTRWDPEAAYDAWPLVLPHHRDLIAAHLTPELVRAKASTSPAGPALIKLAEADGAVGGALLTTLGYGLAAKGAQTQAAAVDALLVLVARKQLEPDTLAAILSTLARKRDITLNRLIGPLLDLARAGAARQVWETLRALLGDLLVDPPVGVSLADLLALTAEVALLDHSSRGPVPGLDALAARKGSSRQLVEARRLKEILRDR